MIRLRCYPRLPLLALLFPILAFSIWVALQDMFFPIQDCCQSSDGTRLATLHSQKYPPKDGVVRLWDLESGRLRRSLRCDASSLMFSPDGRFLVSGNEGGSITVYDVETLSIRKTIQVDNSAAYPTGFAEDGETLFVWTAGPKILIVNILTGEIADPQVRLGNWRATNGRYLLMADFDTTKQGGRAAVYKIDSRGAVELRSLPLNSKPGAVAMSNNGRHVAISLPRQMQILLWTLDGDKQSSLKTRARPHLLTFAADAEKLVAISKSGQAEIWSVTSRHRIDKWSTIRPTLLWPVRPVESSGLVHQLVTGITLRDLETGDIVAELPMRLSTFLFLSALSLAMIASWSGSWIRAGLKATRFHPALDVAVIHAALVSILLIRFWTSGSRQSLSRPILWILFAEIVVLTSLATIWMTSSSRRWPIRLSGLIVSTSLIGAVCVTFWHGASHVIWQISVGSASLIGCLAAPLLYLRRRGFVIAGADLTDRGQHSLPPSQLTLRDLILVCGAIAGFFAVARFFDPSSIPGWLFLFLMLNGGTYAVSVAVGLWAALGRSAWWLRAIIFLITGGTIGFVPTAIFYNSRALPWWWYLIVHVLIAVITLATMLVFRWHGYRFRHGVP